MLELFASSAGYRERIDDLLAFLEGASLSHSLDLAGALTNVKRDIAGQLPLPHERGVAGWTPANEPEQVPCSTE